MAAECNFVKFKFFRAFYTKTGHARSEIFGLLRIQIRYKQKLSLVIKH